MILRGHDIQVVNKPLKTLQQEFPPYVGETGQCFETRKKEHIGNDKTSANGSNIAKHAWLFDHRVDFYNSSVIDKGSFRIGGLAHLCYQAC